MNSFEKYKLGKISREKFKDIKSQIYEDILRLEEEFRPIKFYDVGALVWFARIIEWEFPNFSVDKCLDNLYKAQEILEKKGSIEGRYIGYCWFVGSKI